MRKELQKVKNDFQSALDDLSDLANYLGISYNFGKGDDLSNRVSQDDWDLLKNTKNEGGLAALWKLLAQLRGNQNKGNIFSVTYNAGGRGYTVQRSGAGNDSGLGVIGNG